jgi:uncharacterized protein (TIGR02588 family)
VTEAEKNKPANEHSGEAIPLLEWIAGTLGFLIVAGVVGYLLVQAFTGDHSAPDLRIEVENTAQIKNGYRVEVRVTNLGSETAADVQIEGELTQNGESVEASQAGIDYIAGKSSNAIGLFFTENPAQYTLELRALGYQSP